MIVDQRVETVRRGIFVRALVDELLGEPVERFLEVVIVEVFAQLAVDDVEDLGDPRRPRRF
jgi:hypothetical protein